MIRRRKMKKMGDDDHTQSLPDECLALILNLLTTSEDRNNSSLVSRRWLQIDAQTRTHLTLEAQVDLQPFIPSIFTRFNSLTQLVLRNKKYHFSIDDEDINLITSMCPNLTRLKLRMCDQLTDSGMAAFSKNCTKLKQFSCAFCSFSDLGIFKLLHNSSQLEVLSVERCNTTKEEEEDEVVLSSLPALKTLKVIKLKQVYNERLFIPLISGSKNLKILKLLHCDGNWDKALEMIQDDNCLAEVYLEDVDVTDVGVSSLSKCRRLNDLCIADTRCTDVGFIRVAQNCKGLKKLYVGSEIGDEGLIAVGRHNVNLHELGLFRVDATCDSLQVIATNCQKLVRLELCMNDTITDDEIMCIADKCVALKILCLDGCDVSNKGIEAFALGSPNLAEITVIDCKKVTREAIDRLRASRESLVIKMGTGWLRLLY